MSGSRRFRAARRRGSVTVEMALLAPVLVGLLFGMVEASRMYSAQNLLATAAREGARFAAMDRTDKLLDGQTSNEKIIDNVKSFLEASGLPADDIDVFIVDPDDHTTPFDLDNPANELKLFELRIEVPASAVGGASGYMSPSSALVSKLIFRNAPSMLVQ